AMVVNLDIQGFFPNTTHEQVLIALRRDLTPLLSETAVRFLAEICCFRGGLPIGAPTSPALANLVMRPIDASLAKAAKRFDLQYTRYADDLTFSGGTDAHRIIPFVEKVLSERGYEIEGKKTNIFRRGRRQIVTGLVVNERVNLPRHIRRKLRAAVHRRTKGGQPMWHGRPITDSELQGYVAALGAVRPEESAAHRGKLRGRKE
ncbi:reverse transcriptase family protein, partial [Gemmatimonadota bacterium]